MREGLVVVDSKGGEGNMEINEENQYLFVLVCEITFLIMSRS